MYCQACGTQNEEDSAYCRKCGTALPAGKQLALAGAGGTLIGVHSERVAASMKSYTGAAVVVFLLYWLFWLPGLIVNTIYYRESRRMERLAGQSLPGVGCLTVMLWLNVLGAALGGLCFCATFGFGLL